jgi:hypothetical protein
MLVFLHEFLEIMNEKSRNKYMKEAGERYLVEYSFLNIFERKPSHL